MGPKKHIFRPYQTRQPTTARNFLERPRWTLGFPFLGRWGIISFETCKRPTIPVADSYFASINYLLNNC